MRGFACGIAALFLFYSRKFRSCCKCVGLIVTLLGIYFLNPSEHSLFLRPQINVKQQIETEDLPVCCRGDFLEKPFVSVHKIDPHKHFIPGCSGQCGNKCLSQPGNGTKDACIPGCIPDVQAAFPDVQKPAARSVFS